MDVVDHLITVLRTVLDYVGVDFDELPHPEWLQRREELRFRARSLVRLIATLLPPKPARRLHLQPALIGGDCYGIEYESLYTSFHDDLENDLGDLTTDDLVWVEEDLGNNCIQLRPKNRQSVDKKEKVEEMDKGLFVMRRFPEQQTSTPINQSLSTTSQTDPAAMMKISVLEDELTKLRLQIAEIVLAQENNTFQKSTVFPESASILSGESHGVEAVDGGEEQPVKVNFDLCTESVPPSPPPLLSTVTDVPTPPILTNTIPPAPCPPPIHTAPPSTPTTSKAHPQTVNTPLSQLLSKRKEELEGNKESRKPSAPATLTDVLRGLGSVKLRSIERSPGGTPLRSAPKQVSHTDPTFLIAQALKKKFALHHVHGSPDTDKENEFSSSSTETTPKAPPVPHLLKKRMPRRRSSLCRDTTDIIQSAPLRDKNMRI